MVLRSPGATDFTIRVSEDAVTWGSEEVALGGQGGSAGAQGSGPVLHTEGVQAMGFFLTLAGCQAMGLLLTLAGLQATGSVLSPAGTEVALDLGEVSKGAGVQGTAGLKATGVSRRTVARQVTAAGARDTQRSAPLRTGREKATVASTSMSSSDPAP